MVRREAANRDIRIIYVGPLFFGSTCLMRMNSLSRLGFDVVGVESGNPTTYRGFYQRAIDSVARRAGYPIDRAGANLAIERQVLESRFDVLWIDKGLTIRPRTLHLVKTVQPWIRLVAFTPDDMMGRHNQSKYYLAGVPLYDLHITTKSFNGAELEAIGARRTIFIPNGYDTEIHKPVDTNEFTRTSLGGEVGFIGDYEEERAASVLYLARNGIPVRVWGMGRWQKLVNAHPLLRIEAGPLWGIEYAKAICSFDINLCFLRKVNRDLQTTRSIEIPACGRFMLAERTTEHTSLFREGVEADFFSDNDELLRKVQYYRRNTAEARQIGLAGRKRCEESGYDYTSRLGRILNVIL